MMYLIPTKITVNTLMQVGKELEMRSMLNKKGGLTLSRKVYGAFAFHMCIWFHLIYEPLWPLCSLYWHFGNNQNFWTSSSLVS